MTEKELHKLRRQDLLQLLVLQSKEMADLHTKADELSAGYERLKAKLDEKDATIERLKGRLDDKDATIAGLKVEAMERAAADDAAGAMDPEALMDVIRTAILTYADRSNIRQIHIYDAGSPAMDGRATGNTIGGTDRDERLLCLDSETGDDEEQEETADT